VVEWIVPALSPGTRTLSLRYASDTSHDVTVALAINGVVIDSEHVFPSTGASDAWNATGVCTYLNHGSNVVRLTTASPGAGLYLDALQVLDDDTDLAFDRDAIASSEEADYPAAQAVDANCSTCWIASGYPQWMEIDLGFVHSVHRTELVCRADRAYRFHIESRRSLEDPYTLVVDRSNNETPGSLDSPISDTFEATPARYLRLTITGAGDYAGTEVAIAEFAVFGTAQTPAISIGTQGYATLQTAIGAAGPDETIVVRPGLYRTSVRVVDQAVRLASIDPDDPSVTRVTVIEGSPDKPVAAIDSPPGETELAGLTLTGGSCGLQCNEASVRLHNCQLISNHGPGIELIACPAYVDHCLVAVNRGAGISMVSKPGRFIVPGTAEVVNCTFAQNTDAAIVHGQLTATNSIFWLNGDGLAPQIQTDSPELRHCATDIDPCFVSLGARIEPSDPDSEWLPGDYHLLPESPGIDAGDPTAPVGAEPEPHGGRVNLGAYGGTTEATTSE
jgi:hypothetical protein